VRPTLVHNGAHHVEYVIIETGAVDDCETIALPRVECRLRRCLVEASKSTRTTMHVQNSGTKDIAFLQSEQTEAMA
jgi:hypothetical protein